MSKTIEVYGTTVEHDNGMYFLPRSHHPVRFTAHAMLQMGRRGVRLDEVLWVLLKPEVRYTQNDHPNPQGEVKLNRINQRGELFVVTTVDHDGLEDTCEFVLTTGLVKAPEGQARWNDADCRNRVRTPRV